MQELMHLRSLAELMGVRTRFTDGFHRPVDVSPETLVRVCAALGAEVHRPSGAGAALAAMKAGLRHPSVHVAWDGRLPSITIAGGAPVLAELRLEHGGVVEVEVSGGEVSVDGPIPLGYHSLVVESAGVVETRTVIASPTSAWRRPGSGRSWGLGTQLAALRSTRSRSLGDLRDLETLCRWTAAKGGDLVTVLPLLPTFNQSPPEPSPYSPVSRLFWSELMLDLGDAHRSTEPPETLDVTRGDVEVRSALRHRPTPDPSLLDDELIRYARFRGAQARLGRNWRQWPAGARAGTPRFADIDPEEERFHLVAQTAARGQLRELSQRLDADGVRLGLDLAVGAHPDGYDPWSRQGLFAEGMSVGAPPDPGFPSGQDWGFSPVLPEASRQEGHRYVAASIAHQAGLAGVLRVDHVMALSRLYWIPHGAGLHEGTYVTYPAEELFAVLTLESHRNRCEVVGENLGTVPPEIDEALPRHRIWGMFLAQFEAASKEPAPPTARDVALIGTHDTPTFTGWLAGVDIEERARVGLLEETAVPAEREGRANAVERLARTLGCAVGQPRAFLGSLLDWLGRSGCPLVIPWLEDLWLEERQVNLPGTPSSVRPNWQRPMARLLDDIMADPEVDALVRLLHFARTEGRAEPSALDEPRP